MKNYRLIDNLIGWVVFAVAAFVYCSTIEPTASFWDCPEFITTGYKLEVGHPPGAPFFMLVANLFTQFVSDASQVARMVNTMSALLSAACILFLFWSITHLARRLVAPNKETMTLGQLITIQASGVVGALAYTFSDTFWFSAVEGEVYAFSSAFTAVVFWLILKWEEQADQPHSDRWLILIAYLTGLSIGVHLLNLLCIPAICLVVYYKRAKNADVKGSLIALVAGSILVAAVLYGIVPGIVRVGGWFELLFVNVLGLAFNSGTIFYLALLTGVVLWAIWETITARSRKRMNISFLASVALLGIPFYGSTATMQILIGTVILVLLGVVLFVNVKGQRLATPRILNTTLLCMLMIMIGYSSYALIVIRSTANPPMDQNSPEDIFTLGEYLGREQYGTRPLFYGQAYTSQLKYVADEERGYYVAATKQGAPVYQRREKASPDEQDRYDIIRYKRDYIYEQNMLFPRMYDNGHAQDYEAWMGGVKGTQVNYRRPNGEMATVKMPTQAENIYFFLSYQLNFMYWRYFMWNFAGRQNDVQGSGETEHGNWITGFKWLDDMRLGDQSLLPDDLKNNKGHNVFYCLPLILGLLGLFWQSYKGKEGVQQFWVVFFLFFMTGIAIVLYLNQTPVQPRERDYAYAGSFYAFAIWIGLGVAAIVDGLKRIKVPEAVAAALAALACLMVPLQMASQTWDDHDRSGRYACRDFGRNYLNSLDEKGAPIVFTNGDNDTFPLWYNQDTEGFRTDARVCNLSYLQTDWYIDQMRRPAYDSPSLPITWQRLQYVDGKNDYVSIQPDLKSQVLALYQENREQASQIWGENPFELSNIIEHWILNPVNEDYRVIPTDTVEITVDKEAVRQSGMLITDSIPDKMYIALKGNALYKADLMMLEMLAHANWTRPLYMSITVGSSAYSINLDNHFMLEGLAYRVVPFDTNKTHITMDVDRMYDNMMNKFQFGGVNTPGIYLDETVRRLCTTHRHMFGSLIKALIRQGEKEKALKALDFIEEKIPSTILPHSYQTGSLDLASSYLAIGQKEKGMKILSEIETNAEQYFTWYLSQSSNRLKLSADRAQMQLYILNEIVQTLAPYDRPAADKLYAQLDGMIAQLQNRLGRNIE